MQWEPRSRGSASVCRMCSARAAVRRSALVGRRSLVGMTSVASSAAIDTRIDARTPSSETAGMTAPQPGFWHAKGDVAMKCSLAKASAVFALSSRVLCLLFPLFRLVAALRIDAAYADPVVTSTSLSSAPSSRSCLADSATFVSKLEKLGFVLSPPLEGVLDPEDALGAETTDGVRSPRVTDSGDSLWLPPGCSKAGDRSPDSGSGVGVVLRDPYPLSSSTSISSSWSSSADSR
ncbi:unnamed protein product [Mycena citricolor]|uniref:Uncharacterized protein n=1 Tax=Mycena citricolor TaxID=2018698 RepID=A0AAD2K054_9AGAR|nr:unnamed protein product [Mycena citricolor]